MTFWNTLLSEGLKCLMRQRRSRWLVGEGGAVAAFTKKHLRRSLRHGRCLDRRKSLRCRIKL